MFKIKYRYLLIVLLSVYSYLNILYTVGEKLFDFEIPGVYVLGILTTVVFGIWEFNRLIESQLDKLHRFFPGKIHPLIILFILSMIGAGVISAITLMGLYAILDMPFVFNETHIKLLSAFAFRVNLFLNCVNAIVYYMERLKRTQVEAEKLKKISIEAQFEALRNQINPHFLFNCFNVLSSLVYKDADTSAKFIAQLSNVYRYLLFNQDKKVILLKEELSFMDSYLYLLKIRFGENVIVEKRITVNDEQFYIAPATLQMLIENAIKHNVAAKKNPLCISISTENGYILVVNNLSEKEDKEPSTHIGLNNIQSRYNFLSDKNIIIEKNNYEFKVSIPLLEME